MAEESKHCRPQERWAAKNDYITKGFKMYRKQADDFAEACKKVGVSQAAKITELIQGFVDAVNRGEYY